MADPKLVFFLLFGSDNVKSSIALFIPSVIFQLFSLQIFSNCLVLSALNLISNSVLLFV